MKHEQLRWRGFLYLVCCHTDRKLVLLMQLADSLCTTFARVYMHDSKGNAHGKPHLYGREDRCRAE